MTSGLVPTAELNTIKGISRADSTVARSFASQPVCPLLLRKIVLWAEMNILIAISLTLMTPTTAAGQTNLVSPQIKEVWLGAVLNADFHGPYSVSFFGLAELASPRAFRNSEYFAGLRLSRTTSTTSRFGIECLQDRSYLSNSGLFLENRCATDFSRRWSVSSNTRIYLRPKLEFRSLSGTFDLRLKVQTELLQNVHALRGTFRGYIEPAIDQQFRGFEKVIVHTGMLWPVSKRVKFELFNSVSVAKRPDYGIEALGMVLFIQLQDNDRAGGEVIR